MSFYSGDSQLSAMDMRLWSLAQAVLLRFNTFVVFKHECFNVPLGKREMIAFFVPGDATLYGEIVAFLETELAPLRREDRPAGRPNAQPGDLDFGFPGSDVVIAASIEPFSGMVPYLTNAQMEVVVREAMSTVMQRMKRDTGSS